MMAVKPLQASNLAASGLVARALGQMLGDSRIPVDLFIIVGQSNAEGRGSSASSPPAPRGVYISGSTITSPLADPVGGASTGSAWPSFCNEWFSQTGHISAYVDAATGGTPLLPDAAGSNWSPSGTLRGAAVTAVNNAIGAINSSPMYSLGSVYFIWAQGESDAQTINGTTVSGPLYEQALEDLAAYFKAQVPQMVTMGVVQTGCQGGAGVNQTNWAAIRLAQESACTDSANLVMLYRGTFSYRAQGYMADTLHYNQSGLNTAGKCAALALATGTAAVPDAPAVLATATLEDADVAASSATATKSHTTAAGTKAIYVAGASIRVSNNTTFTNSGCTFGGVAMREVLEGNAGNTTLCRVNVSVFYIDETMYGGSLDGVTADVVWTCSATANIIDFAIGDLDAAGVIEESRSANVTGGATGTATTVNLTTSAPSTVVVASASAAAGAAALTASWNDGTEIMEHGLSNGTRGGQFSCVRDDHASAVVDQAYTATWSGTCDAIATVGVAFRGKIAGE